MPSGRLASCALLAATLMLAACVPSPLPPSGSSGRNSAVTTPDGSQSVSASPSATTSPAPGTRRIVVLGDSNSATYFSGFGQGPPWPERMLSDFATRFPGAKLELVNSAQFGRTSADVLRTLDQDCLNRSPSIVVLMIGTNDPGYGIPLAQTTANVRAILQRVKALRTASGTPVVVVFAQPPVAQSKHVAETKHIYPAWCPYDQTEDPSNSLKPMKDRYRRLADELDVAFVPVWDRFAERGYDGSQPVKSAYLFDGLHLASEGQRLVATWIGDEIAMRME